MKGMYLALIFSLLMGVGVSAGLAQSGEHLFGEALVKGQSEGDIEGAIELGQRVVREFSGDRGLAPKTLLQMGRSYEKLSKAEARKAARETDERVVDEYAGQAAPPRVARARLAALARPAIPSDRPTMRARQVWAGPGANTLGQPSLDGRHLSFVDWETGDLAVRELASGKNRRLTHKGSWQDSKEYAHFSTISPDGRRVAYAWLNKKNFYELRVVDLDRSRVRLPYPNLEMRFVEPSVVPTDETPIRMLYRDKDEFGLGLAGSQPRVLYRNEEVQFIKPSAWSPDGKQILALFFGKGILNQIVLVSVADGSVRVLKSPLWIYPKKMSFSPDGRYVVYDLNQDPHFPQRDIFVLATDGSREIPLVKHVADDMFPVWAPDGGSILFASNRTGTLDAWVIRVADGKPRGSPVLVKRNLGRFLPMGFTSKGAFYYGLRAGTEDAYVAALDLATGKLLKSPAPVSQRFPGANRSPDWSPDGQYLAYLSRVGTENQGLETRVITIRSLKDGEERRLVPKLGYLDWLRWSPDGRSLLVGGSSDTRNSSGVYRVDAQTGDLSPIVLAASEAPNGLQAVWSAEGEAIFYLGGYTHQTDGGPKALLGRRGDGSLRAETDSCP